MAEPHRPRTAVVTGAARGIGRAIAERLHAEGARVALVDQRDASELARAFSDRGQPCRSFTCDLGDAEAVSCLMEALIDWAGPCDILVNNAGLFPTTPLETLTLSEWRAVFAVNVDAPMLLSIGLAPGMRKAGWGRIINIASSTVGIVRRDIAPYVASKMALIGLSRALASDLGSCGITVNAVAPGLTESEGVLEKFEAFDRLRDSIVSRQSVPRLAMPMDIAAAVSFLASDGAAMITGQTWVVDGGWVRL